MVNPKILRELLRELSTRSGAARTPLDWERVRPLVTTVWERMEQDWPRLRDWFKDGLGDVQWRRYVSLAQKLPNRLSAEERSELLELTLRGLRLTEKRTEDVEGRLAAGEQPRATAAGERAEPRAAGGGEAGEGGEEGSPTSADPPRPVVVAAGEGQTTAYGMRHKLRAEWLGGAVAALETTVAPGQVVPAHTHSREDEASYVVSGELGFRVGDEEISASTGAWVVKPRGVVHAFWNSGSEPAVVMELHAPGNLGSYYDEVHELEASGMEGDERRTAFTALQARFGIEPDPALTRALSERHGVKV